MRESCEYCGKGFSMGTLTDMGVGMMYTSGPEPMCDCCDLSSCLVCDATMLLGEMADHDCGGDNDA